MEKINLKEAKIAVIKEFKEYMDTYTEDLIKKKETSNTFEFQKNGKYTDVLLAAAIEILVKHYGEDCYQEERRQDIYPALEALNVLYSEKYDSDKVSKFTLSDRRGGPLRAAIQTVFSYKEGQQRRAEDKKSEISTGTLRKVDEVIV